MYKLADKESDCLPLSGLTVIDCGQVIAGPTMAMILGDFGAEVIKVENPVGGDQGRNFGPSKNGVPLLWKQLSRNKKTITLSLSKPAGQELFCRLIEKTRADILIESFRAGTFERWNLGYERLRALSPGLTMIRISGFGQTGPYKDRPGFGTLAEAMGGIAHVTGEPDGPPMLTPFPLGDTVAALYATIASLLCIYQRDAKNRGRGQVVDVSLLESVYTMVSGHAMAYDQLGQPGQRTGNRTSGSAPRNTYLTKDGRWVVIAGSTQALTERLFNAMERPDLIHDARFTTNRDRVANVAALDNIVGAWVRERNQKECVERLIDAEVAVATVADFKDLAEDPHMLARNALASIEDPELGLLRMPDVMPKLSETPGRIKHTGLPMGAFNKEIYLERLGLSARELEQLESEGVI